MSTTTEHDLIDEPAEGFTTVEVAEAEAGQDAYPVINDGDATIEGKLLPQVWAQPVEVEGATVRFFGRQPVMWLAILEAAAQAAILFGLPGLTTENTALAMGVVAALFGVAVAYFTSERGLAAVSALIKAAAAFAVLFGVEVSTEQIASLVGFATVGVAFWQQPKTTPAEGFSQLGRHYDVDGDGLAG
ncbi:hypothetical protein K0651_01780 [Ornithinimicrobium sp. Arc0846-15]|nr:hypothetical protein [Ornithinimicrobium laminariae]